MGAFWIAILCDLSGKPFDPIAAIVLCLVTFAIYALDRAGGSKEDLLNNPGRAILAKYPIKQLAYLSYVLALFIVVATDFSKIPFVLVPGIAGFLYTSRIAGIRPKDLPGCKTLIVAGSTAICRAGLIGGAPWLYVLVFLAMIIDTVLFDLKDIRGDKENGVRTIPVILGRRKTLLILAIVDLMLFAFSTEIAILGAVWLAYFAKDRPIWQYDFLVDGWMMWALFLKLALVSIL